MPRRHDSTDDAGSNYRKRRRNRMRVSCLNCYASKRKCDRKRPCTRCIQHGLTGLCVYELDDPSSRDPDRDEVTHLRSRIAELESIIRELNNRPHPRWLAADHGRARDVRRYLDGASSESWSRPPKRKTAAKAAAKNSLDAFFDAALESDEGACKRIKVEQPDSDDEYMPESSKAAASPPPPFLMSSSPLTPLSSTTPSPHHWTPFERGVSTPSSSISEALLAELEGPPFQDEYDAPRRRPSSPFPFLRRSPRLLYPPTPGDVYPSSDSDTSDDIPLAQCLDDDPVISRAIQTSPSPPPQACPCLTMRSLYTPLLYFASALRDARTVLEAVHGGGHNACEFWSRVKALEEYVFSQDRMAGEAQPPATRPPPTPSSSSEDASPMDDSPFAYPYLNALSLDLYGDACYDAAPMFYDYHGGAESPDCVEQADA